MPGLLLSTFGGVLINRRGDDGKFHMPYLIIIQTSRYRDMNKNNYTDLLARAPIYGQWENGWKSTSAYFNSRYLEQTIPIYTRWIGSWQISLQRRMFSSPELVRRYDQAAPKWERTLKRFGYLRAYESLLRNVLSADTQDIVEPPPRVLDCGVGTGALSIAFARVLSKPYKLDAIDISLRMLEWAGYNLRHANLQVALRQADVCRLPYDDGVFDFVMSAHVLEHLIDPRVAIKEMVRVLKLGGYLVACLTRRSVLGMFVRLKWRTHWVPPEQIQNWLSESGLQNAHCLVPEKHALFKQLSLACVGEKPRLQPLKVCQYRA
jgi:demethylmenaquinone methyltransferase/2-methoxy-6-polyprenyl-1,4-benzoquinol methylase